LTGGHAHIEGRVIANPLFGERIRFLKTAPDTNGELVQYESWMAPGGTVGVAHIHPIQTSHFLVISGRASFRVNGGDIELGPGEQLTVPPRTPHRLWNSGDAEAHLIVEFRPGLLKQEFFETTFGLARDGMSYPHGMGNIFQRAVLTAAYRNESRPLGQSRLSQLGLICLAPVAWLLGYRAHYPRYCTRLDGTSLIAQAEQ
jgi:mannose-6-phosphate isomerase-like protein (cupin superfamily)